MSHKLLCHVRGEILRNWNKLVNHLFVEILFEKTILYQTKRSERICTKASTKKNYLEAHADMLFAFYKVAVFVP